MGLSLLRKGFIALEGHKDILVAHEILTGEAIARRHVVYFRVHDLLACDFAELPQKLLFFFGEGNAVLALRRQVLDLDKARAAFAILAIEGDRDLVSLSDGKDRAAVSCNRIHGDVFSHDRGRKRYVSHWNSPLFRSRFRPSEDMQWRAARSWGRKTRGVMEQRVAMVMPMR